MEACLLLRWLRETNAEHVHAHFGSNPAAVAMLCRVLGGPPFSFTAHGSADIGKAERMALCEKVRRAKFVVAVSEFGRSQLRRVCGAEHWSKIHVVHCGVDESFLDAPRTQIPLSPHLVCIGRLSAEKGHEVLIEAARHLAREGVAFELTLVGDGPRRSALEALIQQYGLKDCLRIAGWASGAEVREQVQAARALVLPSHYEGLPVVIMEAFALGRPVIATRVGGVPELVEPGVNGWLVAPGSAEALADAMRQALTAPVHELEKMGSAGASRVREQHDATVEARKLSRLFQESIAAGGLSETAAVPIFGLSQREQSASAPIDHVSASQSALGSRS
jgi:glycosyltransferase involved in cell wall biosynthesis